MSKSNWFTDRFIGQLPPEDVATALMIRDWSKGVFDFLKNLVLLGALKYLAEKTQNPFVEFAFATCALFLVMFCFSFLLAWRVRLVSAFRRNRYTESVDVVLNTIALLAIQLGMVAFTIRIANQLALAQGH